MRLGKDTKRVVNALEGRYYHTVVPPTSEHEISHTRFGPSFYAGNGKGTGDLGMTGNGRSGRKRKPALVRELEGQRGHRPIPRKPPDAARRSCRSTSPPPSA